jgi:hypothetical protein
MLIISQSIINSIIFKYPLAYVITRSPFFKKNIAVIYCLKKMDLLDKVVECVPNFSEGCDSTIINSISKAISETKGCILVDVDAGTSTNRTVYTFFGTPESVVEGALNGALKASELIDMKNHTGRIYLCCGVYIYAVENFHVIS